MDKEFLKKDAYPGVQKVAGIDMHGLVLRLGVGTWHRPYCLV